MIQFKDVIDFRKKEKKIFDKFDEELANIVKINKLIKPKYWKLSFAKNPAEESRYKVEHKGTTYTKSAQDMFWDLLLNGYNDIKSNKEFKFISSNPKEALKYISLHTREEKLAFLTSLYSIIFDVDYVKSIDVNTLQRALIDNKILFFFISHQNPLASQNTQIQISDKAQAEKLDRRISVKTHKRYNYITGDKIISEINSLRKRIDKDTIYQHEEEKYERLKILVKEKEFFPKKTQEKALKIINKPSVKDMIGNISNEFALKTAIKSLPQKLNETIYEKLITGIQLNKENNKLTIEEKRFLTAKLLLDKYTYEKMGNLKYASWASTENLRNIKFDRNKYYKKVYEAEEAFITSSTNKYFEETPNKNSYELIQLLFSMVVLYNQPEEKLKTIVENTKNSFEKFAKTVAFGVSSSLIDLYNVENIKDKTLFKTITNPYSQYLYSKQKQHTIGFATKNSAPNLNHLNYLVLESTVYKSSYYLNAEGDRPRDQDFEPILKDIVDLFDLAVK